MIHARRCITKSIDITKSTISIVSLIIPGKGSNKVQFPGCFTVFAEFLFWVARSTPPPPPPQTANPCIRFELGNRNFQTCMGHGGGRSPPENFIQGQNLGDQGFKTHFQPIFSWPAQTLTYFGYLGSRISLKALNRGAKQKWI